MIGDASILVANEGSIGNGGPFLLTTVFPMSLVFVLTEQSSWIGKLHDGRIAGRNGVTPDGDSGVGDRDRH